MRPNAEVIFTLNPGNANVLFKTGPIQKKSKIGCRFSGPCATLVISWLVERGRTSDVAPGDDASLSKTRLNRPKKTGHCENPDFPPTRSTQSPRPQGWRWLPIQET